MKERYLFTSDEFVTAKNILKKKINESKTKYDYLVGNLRGGFYLVDALSRDLNIPYMLCHVSFRDTSNLQGGNILIPRFEGYKNYLLVDDLIDSGKTISYFEAKKNIDYCMLFNNPSITSEKKIISYKELPYNTWIDFFWEKY